MKWLIDSRLFITLGMVGLSACTTPQPVRESAKFSTGQLAVLQSELRSYAASSNNANKERAERLIEQFNDQLRQERTMVDTLYITTGATKLSDKLVEVADRYKSRENDEEGLIKPELARLSGLTKFVQFSSESFDKAMKALAELGDEEDIDEQIVFIKNYVQDVQDSIVKEKEAQSE